MRLNEFLENKGMKETNIFWMPIMFKTMNVNKKDRKMKNRILGKNSKLKDRKEVKQEGLEILKDGER